MVDEMHDGIDAYVSREASYHPSVETSPIALFFSSFANRWASPGEQLYSQRYWRFSDPYVQSTIWSNHLIPQLRMVQ
jgi:hypothetical protein